MGRETKTFREREWSLLQSSPHLEIVPTNLAFFFFFCRGGVCAPLSPHSSTDLTATERFMSQRRHCIWCNTLALHTAWDKRSNASQPPAGFPSQLSVGSGGEGMEFWEFCASSWCLKSITPWLPSGGKGGHPSSTAILPSIDVPSLVQLFMSSTAKQYRPLTSSQRF